MNLSASSKYMSLVQHLLIESVDNSFNRQRIKDVHIISLCFSCVPYKKYLTVNDSSSADCKLFDGMK
uniref:Uncharacterized protein n=1 Tax=Octopus bimaculoides TaxID=37653 RepID=A0A0L8H443_OCTBM